MGKQVKTPRFYVDIPSFLHATGDLQWAHGGHHLTYNGGTNHGGAELLYLNPANPFLRKAPHNNTQPNSYIFKIGQNYQTGNGGAKPKVAWKPNYFALLNHNLGTSESGNPYIRGRFMQEDYNDTAGGADEEGNTTGDGYFRNVQSTNFLDTNYNPSEVINFNMAHERFAPVYNGTSIMTIDNTTPKFYTTFEVFHGTGQEYGVAYPHQLGSFSVGRYWDAPNSPDLHLTMERRFEGIKRQKTIGGKTLANIYYDGPTEWTMFRYLGDGSYRDYDWAANSFLADWDAYYGDSEGKIWGYKYAPFELDQVGKIDSQWSGANMEHIDSRVKSGLGRKGLRSWKLTFSYISESDMWMDNEVSNNIISDSTTAAGSCPMLEDDSFNFVWNCTLGGTLPFIFQPDKTNNKPDQFSICNFRDNSLSVKQVASNVYSLSITIDEIG